MAFSPPPSIPPYNVVAIIESARSLYARTQINAWFIICRVYTETLSEYYNALSDWHYGCIFACLAFSLRQATWPIEWRCRWSPFSWPSARYQLFAHHNNENRTASLSLHFIIINQLVLWDPPVNYYSISGRQGSISNPKRSASWHQLSGTLCLQLRKVPLYHHHFQGTPDNWTVLCCIWRNLWSAQFHDINTSIGQTIIKIIMLLLVGLIHCGEYLWCCHHDRAVARVHSVHFGERRTTWAYHPPLWGDIVLVIVGLRSRQQNMHSHKILSSW